MTLLNQARLWFYEVWSATCTLQPSLEMIISSYLHKKLGWKLDLWWFSSVWGCSAPHSIRNKGTTGKAVAGKGLPLLCVAADKKASSCTQFWASRYRGWGQAWGSMGLTGTCWGLVCGACTETSLNKIWICNVGKRFDPMRYFIFLLLYSIHRWLLFL